LRLSAAGECEAETQIEIAPVGEPLEILVAEDNRTNQMVISQILSRGGHRATIVDNGDRAVDSLLQNKFDLVLMDINMPVMNGLEASKFYAFCMLGQQATPIIALTADATPETAAKCRDAGMIDCLNKPIDANALLAVVAKYAPDAQTRAARAAQPPEEEAPPTAPLALVPLPPASAPLQPSAAPVPPASSATRPVLTLVPTSPAPVPAAAVDDPVENGAIDERALRDLAALGGKDFVVEIVTQFVADAAGVLKKLTESVAQQDVEGFRDHAHALRSCAANVGAQAVYRMCLDLRAIEAQELAANGARHVRELEEHFERARVALSTHVA
jgi:two-component system sensor histidine kinase RpfC